MHARAARRVVGSAAAVGVAAAVTASWTATSAAFSAQTASPASSFTAGTVSVTDSGTASASVAGADLLPGSTVIGCTSVTYGGTLPDAVLRTYASGYQQPDALTDPDSLAPYVDVEVRARAGASAADCSDFGAGDGAVVFTGALADLGALDEYATGFGEVVVQPGDVRSFRVSAQVQDVPGSQDGGAGVGLVWEVRR